MPPANASTLTFDVTMSRAYLAMSVHERQDFLFFRRPRLTRLSRAQRKRYRASLQPKRAKGPARTPSHAAQALAILARPDDHSLARELVEIAHRRGP